MNKQQDFFGSYGNYCPTHELLLTEERPWAIWRKSLKSCMCKIYLFGDYMAWGQIPKYNRHMWPEHEKQFYIHEDQLYCQQCIGRMVYYRRIHKDEVPDPRLTFRGRWYQNDLGLTLCRLLFSKEELITREEYENLPTLSALAQ